jgi:hypothetical protein
MPAAADTNTPNPDSLTGDGSPTAARRARGWIRAGRDPPIAAAPSAASAGGRHRVVLHALHHRSTDRARSIG